MHDIDPYRLKISQLRALVAIADVGKFSEAALQLELSQSAISHAIATIEEELGVVLLNRGRQGAILTPVGEQIAQEARQVLRLLEGIGKKAEQARGLDHGHVRLAAFRSIATHVLPLAIAQFQRDYPAVKITITEHRNNREIEDELRSHRADIGFVCLPLATSGLETWELLRDEYLAIFPPSESHLPESITWDELLRYPLIMGPKQTSCYEIIHRHFNSLNVSTDSAYEIVTEDSTIMSMVMQGLGATVIAELAAAPIPKELSIRSLPVPLERVVGVATLADALHPPTTYAFLDTLKHRKFFWNQPIQTPRLRLASA